MIRTKSILQSCIFVLILAFSTDSPISGEEFDINRLQSKIFAAVQKVKPAVVAINDRGAIFSGVLVSKEGHIFTAGHAVRPRARYTVILSDGRQFRTRGLGSNKRVDMAMLKIESDTDLPFAELGDSATLTKNQPCVGISHPGYHQPNRGPVIRFGHILQAVTRNEGMIKSTAKMEPGDSGGPLIDLDGKVIGIHSNIRRAEESNYDVPVNSFMKHWDDLMEPETFYVKGYPSLPQLGFNGSDTNEGVKVTKVVEGGQADKSGLKKGDIVTSVGGYSITKKTQIHSRLFDFREKGTAEIFFNVDRNGDSKSVRIKLKDEKKPVPISYKELADLPKEFVDLESKLDDDVFVIRSKISNTNISVRSTRVKISGRGNLISKSSRVGDNPKVELPGGSLVSAKVVARDIENDLILLDAKLSGAGGVDLRQVWGDMEEKPGKLLLTPHPNANGKISVWGSKYFNVPRTNMTHGFLGVRVSLKNQKVLLGVVPGGAADKAGLKSGDFLIQLNETEINTTDDVFGFLKAKEPNTVIKALILRGDKELTKTIALGVRNYKTGHVADNLIGGKSLRRDGFSLVISHDGDIRPEECGSPVFDLNGQFLGINIARMSRVRTYVVPKTIIKKFVDGAGLQSNSR